ncbi:hypothetical protein [Streptomyces purpureus]|nr:hypothetical protein [Streptomyces purpureus]
MIRSARARRAASAILLACALLGGSVACSAASDAPVEGRDWKWDEKAGAAEAAAFMEVDVPAGATEVKGAVKLVPQDEIRLLSFVTTRKAAEELGRQFEARAPLRVRPARSPGAQDSPDFAHLGLPEPETLKGVRWAGVCPACETDERRASVQWIEISLQALDGDRTRVYLTAW